MTIAKLEDMTKGWFVGRFSPTALDTEAAEVAVKHYTAGDREPLHHHKIATEVTLVLHGTVLMLGREFTTGDIVRLAPGEATDFTAVTPATTVVVKVPCVAGDKYLGEA
jgi:anti-sigma factor ChrR (cupin superfamily)